MKKKKSFVKKIGVFWKKKWEKYNELPKKNRAIINVWAIVLVLIVLLVIVCNINNNNISKYTKMENKMEKAALEYVSENEIHAISSQKVRLDLDLLRKAGFINKLSDDTCVGYVLVFDNKNNKTKAYAYVSCKGYTTDGFSWK